MAQIKKETVMCEFCESLEAWKRARRFSNRHDGYKIKEEYNVALVIRSWTPQKGKRRAGRLVDYRNQGIGFRLNFCPECGREIRRKKGCRKEPEG